MKYFLFLLLSFTLQQGFSQGNHPRTLNKDSLEYYKVKRLTKVLSLDMAQENKLFLLNKDYAARLDTVYTGEQVLEKRKDRISEINRDFMTKLAAILTGQQLDLYKKDVQKQREVFEKHMEDKKIKTTYVDQN